MSTDWLHTHCPGACALIDEAENLIRVSPDAPAGVGGNHWFRFLVGVGATTAARQVHLCWPQDQPGTDAAYGGNHNVATVLDRCCFLDHGDGRWRRIENVAVDGQQALVTVPAGGDGRRLAVGMPVTAIDLHRLLDLVQDSPLADLRRIGHASRGSPLWGITIAEGDQAIGTIVIQALQHASEWAGLRVMEHLIRHLLTAAGAPLRRRWRWLCYPATNADGLYMGWRGDPMQVDDRNPNRDWGTFALPETRAVADDILDQLASGPPLAHALDLHMGWNWRDDPGSAVGVCTPATEPGALPQPVRDWHARCATMLCRDAGFTRHLWPVHQVDRPTFPGWLYRETGLHGQTLEISRHLWPEGDHFVPPDQTREEALGPALASTLDAFLQAHPWAQA